MLNLTASTGQESDPTESFASERKIQQISSWLLMPAPALASFYLNGATNLWLLAFLSITLGVLAYVSKMMPHSTRDYVLSFCFVGHCILFTAALSGHAWQLDAHMLFFAVLAIVSTLSNPRALIFATVLVALHHVSFSILLPKLVYPSGDLMQNIMRTVLHATIVLLETGVLLMSLLKSSAAADELKRQQETTRAQAAAAEQAEANAIQSQKNAEHVVSVVGRHLGEMAQGSLDCTIEKGFPEEYDQLRVDLKKPELSIGEIAYLLDYSEPSAFIRSFKRWTKKTPSQYKQTL